MSAGEHAYWGYAKYFLPQNSIVFNDWSSLSRTECRNLQRFQHRQRVWIRDILIEFSFYTERFFSGYAWSSSLNFVLLENVRSTSVLYKIHKMFLRFLFSQSQFDHLRYNSLTLALSQKTGRKSTRSYSFIAHSLATQEFPVIVDFIYWFSLHSCQNGHVLFVTLYENNTFPTSCRCHARIKSVKVILLVVLKKRMQFKKIARKQNLNNIIIILSSKSKFYFINDLQKPLPSLFQTFNTETNVSVKSKLQHAPPRAYPGDLTPLPSRGGSLSFCRGSRVEGSMSRARVPSMSLKQIRRI